MFPSAIELIYFNEVATELHFSRAAKKLNVSQPSLSLAIKRLEDNLETHLFIRHKNGVTLTRAGTELFLEGKKMLEQWASITSNIRNSSMCIKGKVNIGCHSTIAVVLIETISKLLEKYPGLEINLKHALTPKIMEDIFNGHLDIGITTDPYPYQDVIIHKLRDSEFTYWMSAKRKKKINLKTDELVILCDPQLPPTQDLIKQLQKLRQNKKLVRLSAINQLEVIATMIAQDCGIGILPTVFPQYYLGDKLKKVPNAPVYKKPMCLVYRQENKNVMSIQTVLIAIKQLAQSISNL